MKWNQPRPMLRSLALLAPLFLAGPALAGLNEWSQVGPFGGRVAAVIFHPGNARIAYAATHTNGVFRSTDGGQTWTPANRGLPRRDVAALAIAPGNPVTLYAGGDGWLAKSTDGGASWAATGLTVGVFALAIAPATPRSLVVLSEDLRLFRSDNAGATWRERRLPPLGSLFADFLAVDPRTPDTLYVGRPGSAHLDLLHGLYKSTDAGATWKRLATGLPEPELSYYISHTVAVAPDRPDTLYASTSIVDGAPGLARSTDAGATWTLLGGPGGYPVLALAGGRVVTDRATSTDFGVTWEAHTSPEVRITALTAHPSRPQELLLGAEFRGVFRSADGGATWSLSSRGMTATTVTTVAVGADSTLYAGTDGGGLFASANAGGTWEHLPLPKRTPGDNFIYVGKITVHPRNSRLLYAGVSDQGNILARSDDGGATWTDLHLLTGGQILGDVALDPTAPGTVYASSLGISTITDCRSFKSTDRGATWSCLGLAPAIDFEVDPVDPRNVYSLRQRLAKSTDRGATWTLQGFDRGLPRSVTPIQLVHAPRTSGHLYLATEEGFVFRSTDGGRNWQSATGNLPRPGLPFLALDPRNPAVVYAAVNGRGVYRSRDGGRRWQLLNRGLSGDLLTHGGGTDPVPLAVDPRDPATLYVGTYGRGAYAITLTN